MVSLANVTELHDVGNAAHPELLQKMFSIRIVGSVLKTMYFSLKQLGGKLILMQLSFGANDDDYSNFFQSFVYKCLHYSLFKSPFPSTNTFF